MVSKCSLKDTSTTGNELEIFMRRTVMGGVLAGALLTAGCAGTPASPSTSKVPTPPSKANGERIPANLKESTTFTTIRALPDDPAPGKLPDGTVVSPGVATPIYDAPEGRPVAILPASQLSSPTWVPVVETVPGWQRVLLPSRPNHSSGWIRSDGLETARTAYAIKVRLSSRKLTLYKSGKALATWTVAVGAAGTPTPTGRTFLLASLAPTKPPSGVVLPVGAHSATLDTFGGGPGTVAFHGWPDAKVFGRAASHGCVRIPPAALKALSAVPLGSPVLITS
jgi:lipoprotein-anchoring transpeptidase ErfK/SrfK